MWCPETSKVEYLERLRQIVGMADDEKDKMRFAADEEIAYR